MGEKGRPWGLPFWFGGSRERLWRAAVGRWSFLDRRRVGPATWFPARLRAGARLSPEKAGGKSAGGVAPWTPFFMARSFSLARFGGCSTLSRWWGYYGAHVRALIWKLSFAKMLSSIFSLENASQIGFSIPEETAPLSYQRQRSPKRASESERAIKPGVQGACPRPSFSPFLGRNGDPAGQAGPRGAAPRGTGKAPTTRRVRSTARPPSPSRVAVKRDRKRSIV